MLFVNLTGLLLIGLIVWWFWLYQPKATKLSDDEVVIVVDNGIYTPSRINITAGKAVSLNVLRKDPSPCAEMLLIPAFTISQSLPINQTTTIQLPALQPGEYDFHCQMQMYRGKLIVNSH